MQDPDGANLSSLDSIGSNLFNDNEWSVIAEELSLSPRELQIVRSVFDDAKELAIANHLGISPHTVHTYVERIYRKLAVKSRLQMALRIVAEYLSKTATQESSGKVPPKRPTTERLAFMSSS